MIVERTLMYSSYTPYTIYFRMVVISGSLHKPQPQNPILTLCPSLPRRVLESAEWEAQLQDIKVLLKLRLSFAHNLCIR